MRQVIKPGRQGLAGLFLMAGVMLAAVAAEDPALEGCWRNQQVRTTRADGTRSDSNMDCVTERASGHEHMRCYTPYKVIDRALTYEVTGPGQVQTTVIGDQPGQRNGPTMSRRYLVQGDWLLMDMDVPATSALANTGPGERIVRSQSMALRVKSKSACTLREDSTNRSIDQQSSLILRTAPVGWDPFHRNFDDEDRRKMAGQGFLIGAFLGAGGSDVDHPSPLIIVADDTHFGLAPASPAQLTRLKESLRAKWPSAKWGCSPPDRVDRICLSNSLPQGIGYQELLLLKGRIVRVEGSASRTSPDSMRQLRESVQAFVEQLRKDNED